MDLRNHPAVKIHRFVFLMDKLMDRELKKAGGLSFAQFMILLSVHTKPGLSQKMIASARQTTEAAVSRHIASLIEKGFVTSTISSKDRKVHELTLTKKGEDRYRKDLQVAESTMNHVFSQIRESEAEKLAKSLDVLVETLRAQFPDCVCDSTDDILCTK